MGIKGMHLHIKPYMRPMHMSKFSGRRIGIDGYAWLHRGAVNVASELYTKDPGDRWWEQQNKPPPYISFCMSRIAMLRKLGITPVVVLDGGKLPAKSDTQEARRERKAKNLSKAKEMLAEGNQAGADAIFCQTLDVTPEMAHDLARALSAEGVEFLVAPYEADPQLAYLSQMDEADGGVAAVVTEDSDLIVYGCRELVYKMDGHGHGEGFELDSLLGSPPEWLLQEGGRLQGGILSFRGFTMDILRALGVLAGCDFLPSLKGMGFKKAHSLVSKYKRDFKLDRVLHVIRYDKVTQRQMSEYKEYPDEVRRAIQCFCHAAVYDPGSEALTRLQPLPEDLLGADLGFLGANLPPEVARGIARGHLHPRPPHKALPPLPQPRARPVQNTQAPLEGAAKSVKPKPLQTWMKNASTRSTPANQNIAHRSQARRYVSLKLPTPGASPAIPSRKRARSSGGSTAPRSTPRRAPIAAAVAKAAAAATVLRWRAATCTDTKSSDSGVESIPGDTPEVDKDAREEGKGALSQLTQGAAGSQPCWKAASAAEVDDPVEPIETPCSRVRKSLKAAIAKRESLACRLAFDPNPEKDRPPSAQVKGPENPGPAGGFVRWDAGNRKRKAPSSQKGSGQDGRGAGIKAFLVKRGTPGSSVAGQYESVLYKLVHSAVAARQHAGNKKQKKASRGR